MSETSADRTSIEADIRILKLIELIKLPEIKEILSEEEYEKAISHRFPITILERFFNYSDVRKSWFINFDGANVIINAEKNSFCKAYAELIRRILTGDGDVRVNTRMTATDAPKIIASLPVVEPSAVNWMPSQAIIAVHDIKNTPEANTAKLIHSSVLKNDVNRPKLILGIYTLESNDKKLVDLFEELKKLSVTSYPTCICASMRVFLDISVKLYIEEKGWKNDISKLYKANFKDVTLHKRLSFVKDKLTKNSEEKTIIERLLNPSNDYSLDVLNGYVHSDNTHYELKQFMNGFWDFMFPLFRMMLDIRESSLSTEKNTTLKI